MVNQEQSGDGQPLTRPEVDFFPPQRANLLSGPPGSLSSTVDGISNHLDHLSDQSSTLHKQVNFEHGNRLKSEFYSESCTGLLFVIGVQGRPNSISNLKLY